MSARFEINRDFPFQVALSFDEAAMEVLEWLDDASFEWDMYVDLQANSIRYCFRTVADAMDFKRRFANASERRAVASGHCIGWPHQVVLPARLCEGGGYKQIHEFCAGLTLCSRGHSLCHDGQWFHVYCFREPADAQKFMERFCGEKFDPSERGCGANWARWRKR